MFLIMQFNSKIQVSAISIPRATFFRDGILITLKHPKTMSVSTNGMSAGKRVTLSQMSPLSNAITDLWKPQNGQFNPNNCLVMQGNWWLESHSAIFSIIPTKCLTCQKRLQKGRTCCRPR